MPHRGREVNEGDLDVSERLESSSSTCLSSFSSFRRFVELVRFTLLSQLHSIFSSLASRTSALLKDKKMQPNNVKAMHTPYKNVVCPIKNKICKIERKKNINAPCQLKDIFLKKIEIVCNKTAMNILMKDKKQKN